MKKVLCVLILTCVIIGAAFAQAKPATPAPAPAPAPATAKPAASARVNALGLDLFQLVKGGIATDKDNEFEVLVFVVGYERLINPHYSLGAEVDMYLVTMGSGNTKKEAKYFSITAEGRYYPASETLEKFFIGTTLGFSQLDYDGSTKPEKGGFSGLRTSLKIGYKVITEKGLFLEPSLSYVLQRQSIAVSNGIPLGWNGGLRLGYAF